MSWRLSAADEDRRLAGLMRSAQDGDAGAYRQVLRSCVPVVVAAARRHGVPPDLMDDVVQDVLITLHRALATYDAERPFGPWLWTIAKRRAIDALRRRARRSAREVHDPIAYLNHAEDPWDFVQTAIAQAEAGRLRAAIATLPPRQRKAVEILGLQEHTLEQASHATGSTKVALKVSFSRALRSLRTRLDDNTAA
jgi:RNA polymerase sigma factor (sigma-70 family)